MQSNKFRLFQRDVTLVYAISAGLNALLWMTAWNATDTFTTVLIHALVGGTIGALLARWYAVKPGPVETFILSAQVALAALLVNAMLPSGTMLTVFSLAGLGATFGTAALLLYCLHGTRRRSSL